MQLQQYPLTMIKGVSTSKQQQLYGLGITTIAQLFNHFPYRYDDFSLRSLHTINDGDKITIEGRIITAPGLQQFGRKSRLACKVQIEDQLITAVWFNQPYLREQLIPGRQLALTGKWEQRRLQITVSTTEFSDRSQGRKNTLQAIYYVGGNITQAWMRKTIAQALQQFEEMIPEIIPATLIHRYRLMPRKQAVRAIHMPQNAAEEKQARRRMVYEELLLFQLKLHVMRINACEQVDGIAHQVDEKMIKQFIDSLPFRLTVGQTEAVSHIIQDMNANYCMNRLLQGDVGSGKTIVAAIALYATVKAGYQGALMVPTEILAEQHMRCLTQLFAPHQIQVELLFGSLAMRKRKDILAALQMGMIDIVIGTHALIQEDVYYRRLGLVVTDEQHRFGVNQRSILRRKGLHPDVLLMTATPIPRTLAITTFGDMDISMLRDRPAGRSVIRSYWVKHHMFERVLHFIAREVCAGRQAYIICPLIEQSDKLDVQNAIEVHSQVQQVLPNLKVQLLHGRMTVEDKNEMMHMFSKGETHVLVSTTVVEVGIDVPNATIMVVLDADRFGLSQLHQLRGRVGRGKYPSYCIFIADPKSELGQERMRIISDIDDGFLLSQRDLELRGPGDFFGTKQSGVPHFKIADVTKDVTVLERARQDAAELVHSSCYWSEPEYERLRQTVQQSTLSQGEVWD